MKLCDVCGTGCDDEDKFCGRCGVPLKETENKEDPLIGRRVGEAYILRRLVGIGGMGRVYQADQHALGRTVAINMIHPHLLSDDKIVARFYMEARAASRLNHPNSVGIIDFGRTSDGILYLVMEFLTGNDLSTVVHEEGPLSLPRVLGVVSGVLDALGEAHALDVVHRDLKPENVFLKPQRGGGDWVKVLDFGLATIRDASPAITAPGFICGTPDYMSPEQGKGEPVDGRCDLYSLGVMLFEMLTGRLPFIDTTATKVVVRHIKDPIPDPREVAPARDIPSDVAELCMRALAKLPEQRFQSADEMQAALKKCGVSIRDRASSTFQCPTCGAVNSGKIRFCSACGARVTSTISVTLPPISTPPRLSFQPASESAVSFIGREPDIERLMTLGGEAERRPVWARVVGEVGVGRTRLLNEFAQRCAQQGDIVVGAGPHPTLAPVPYWTVKNLLASLFGIDVSELATLMERDLFVDPMARSGLGEILEPSGILWLDGRSRVGAAAAALGIALQTTIHRSGTRRIIVLVDDFSHCDGPSQQAIALLPIYLSTSPFLLVTVGSLEQGGHGPEILHLQGLTREEGDQLLSALWGTSPRRSNPPSVSSADSPRLLPLYLEHIGSSHREDMNPSRMADAILQKIDRLDLTARRALQAAAVLGVRCPIASLKAVLGSLHSETVELLRTNKLLSVTNGEASFPHPFLRELVEASIPAEVRRTLHSRALEVATERGEPLEVRAEYAYRTGESMSAIVILERMGDTAVRRSDAHAAVSAFRRALELARREMLESGDTVLEGAIVTFSRKLAEALEQAGDVGGADGVLREALDLTGPTGAERAKVLTLLGGVSVSRGRLDEATRLLELALEIVKARGNPSLEPQIYLTMGRVQRSKGQWLQSLRAYRRAYEGSAKHARATALQVRAAVELAELLIDGPSTDESSADSLIAREYLETVLALAREHHADAVVALSLGMLGRLDERCGDRTRALERYQDAARQSAEAGDASGHEQWRRAATLLTDFSARH